MSGRVCSHPGRPLEEHLIQTLELAVSIARQFDLNLAPEDEKVFLLHDIAKAHSAFQRRLCRACSLKNECPAAAQRQKPGGRRRFGHSEPSAALYLAVTSDFFGAEAVRRHHTALEDLHEAVKFWSEELAYRNEEGTGIYDTVKQFCWWNGAPQIAKELGVDVQDWSSLLPAESDWEDMIFNRVICFDDSREVLLEKWVALRLLFSLLVTADRWDASAGVDLEYRSLRFDLSRIDEYLAGKPKGCISEWRGEVRSRVVSTADSTVSLPGVYTITLPTGAGKTITGLEVAARAAGRMGAKSIIYVLPFISLVEQNAKVAGKIFDFVQEDHHLAYLPGGKNMSGAGVEEDNDPARAFVSFFRYWHEPVVVTTMSKFWEVLFSPRANDSMSFHRLSNAVVVLDEPQSIPAEYWAGFGSVLNLLSAKLNTMFILMTATQPEIAVGKELAPECVSFPKDRHKIKWLKEKETIADAVSFLDDKNIKKKDSLVVLNTRVSALKIYCELRRLGLDPHFLSRWVTPKDRVRTIEVIKSKEERQVLRCLVATQVVEAGMDVDFELVFRDLGPLDSIIQIAGRCNRHGEREGQGEVFVAQLIDENQPVRRTFASQVYSSVLLNQTKTLLDKFPEFSEKECRDIVARYYRMVKGAVEEDPLLENLEEGNWGQYLDLYKERRPPEGLVVVDYDGSFLSELKRMLSAERSIENIQERRNFWRKLGQVSISVPVRYIEEWEQVLGAGIISEEDSPLERVTDGMWVINRKAAGQIYHPRVGFVPASFYDEYDDVLAEEEMDAVE